MVVEPPRDPAASGRGLLFGSEAESYERYRLGYADGVLDAILDYAGRPVRTALEVGAGTGKATRLFARRGVRVTALEPDAAMAGVLERVTRDLPVRTVATTFEGFGTTARFDVVYAAAAWHWTDPATRWSRAAGLLAPAGVLALFGSPAELKDPGLCAAVGAIEDRVLAADDGPRLPAWSLEEMAAAQGLTDVEERFLPGTTTTTADAFVGRLSTVSAYLMLPRTERVAALREIHAALPAECTIDTTVRLRLARRR
jgi:SAM-dependent methyltransferase